MIHSWVNGNTSLHSLDLDQFTLDSHTAVDEVLKYFAINSQRDAYTQMI